MLSYWEKEYWTPAQDFAIIGCGIVGLCTALLLREKYPYASISVYDRGNMPSGASTKNAGFVCYGTAGEILSDLESLSEEEVISTVRMRWVGLRMLKKIVPTEEMGYNMLGGMEVFRSEEKFQNCYDQLKYVNGVLEAATGISNTIIHRYQSKAVSYTHLTLPTICSV